MNTSLTYRPDGNGTSAEAVPAGVLIALAAASLAAVALRRPARR